MDFNDTPEEAAYRAKARAWLEANAESIDPTSRRRDLLAEREDERTIAAAKAWQAKKFDAGWACITWPKEYGGQGGTSMQIVIWNQEEAKFKTPPNIYTIGHGMLGPTIMTHGTPEQKTKYIRSDGARRGDLVPALQRARRRLGSRGPAHDARCETATTGSSTARRSGARARTSASGA